METDGDLILELSNGSAKRGGVMCSKERRKCSFWWNYKGCFSEKMSAIFGRIFGENQQLYLRNEKLMIICVIATSVDPLFCYVLLVDEERWCVGIDNKLRAIAIILRSINDLLYIILTAYYFHDHYPLLNEETDSVPVRARKFLLSSTAVDVLAILPLPQVALFVLSRNDGLEFLLAMKALNYVLHVQYFLRVVRIYSFLKKSGWSTFLPQVAEAKAIFNLILYMLASHVMGAFWFLSTIERKAVCWQEQCQHCPLNCNYVSGIAKNANNHFCSAEAAENGSKATFDFGMFKDALPIVCSTDFIRKISCCFWWGLQKLSSLGQDLKTSGDLWEICFAITITIFGLILFALLIGNLQSTISGLEKIRMKERDIEECMSKHSIPWELKRHIRKCKRQQQPETKCVGVEELLQNLPTSLSREVKIHISSNSLYRVLEERLGDVDQRLFEAMNDWLKPKWYNEQKAIVREGGAVNALVFIIEGKVTMVHSNSKQGDTKWLTEGNVFGDELIDWAFNKNPTLTTLPVSTKTIYAFSEIQVLVLVAADLKTIVCKFWWLICKNCSQTSTEMWKPIVISAMQLLWRRNRLKNRNKQ